MKTNSETPRALYLGLDVHKEKTSIAILEAERDAEPRLYGEIGTTQHALERAIRRIAIMRKGRTLMIKGRNEKGTHLISEMSLHVRMSF
jgi:hypothetical protein